MLSFLLICLGTSLTQKPQIYSTKAGAIKGYDPVAYFKQDQPVKGSEDYSYEWMEATWYFSSKENLDAFKESPEAYAPQYGGYCAYAISQGYTARIEPEAWKIVDGKLYLNYNQQIKKKWEANETEFIESADKNWPGVIK